MVKDEDPSLILRKFLIALIPNIIEDINADGFKKLTGKKVQKKYYKDFKAIKGKLQTALIFFGELFFIFINNFS